MKNMTELVIKIPEEQYRTLNATTQNDVVAAIDYALLLEAIKNGTPLPKGHGGLGDLGFLAKRIKAKPPIGDIGKVVLEECYQEILSTKPLIEADKKESEE